MLELKSCNLVPYAKQIAINYTCGPRNTHVVRLLYMIGRFYTRL